MQYSRPISTLDSNGGWRTSQNTFWDFHLELDEVTLNTNSYVYAGGSLISGDPTVYSFEVGMGGVQDPGIHHSHVLNVYANYSGPAYSGIFVELLLGSVVIAGWTLGLTMSAEMYSVSLTQTEAALITNYNNLNLRFHRQGQSGPENIAWVYQAFMTFPDAGFDHADINGAGIGKVGNASGQYLISEGAGFRRVTGVEVTGALIFNLNGNLVVKN